ncbi:hypothetical protein PA25_22370 [Pseudoalteromonas sp. A25]|uniref:hypothetical protein n=1 Tax=Pseudoalteromonas sp. A25 TaxID=116092 RepID=UPI0012613195|nr:hypothetical protein [Pseudoalteromonas sp. A25]BBN82252.1 hypothetical protein PA25_22370 [Pseudoalteromonas sp. A25]
MELMLSVQKANGNGNTCNGKYQYAYYLCENGKKVPMPQQLVMYSAGDISVTLDDDTDKNITIVGATQSFDKNDTNQLTIVAFKPNQIVFNDSHTKNETFYFRVWCKDANNPTESIPCDPQVENTAEPPVVDM